MKTIQNQKEEILRNGKVISKLAKHIHAARSMMCPARVEAKIADEEVLDCSIDDKFEVVDDDNETLCCHPCVEEEETTRCCKNIHPCQQHDEHIDDEVEFDDEVDKILTIIRIQNAVYLKNLDLAMVEAYESSAKPKDDNDDDERKDSVRRDPRPNEYEMINFLDAEDAELNHAETNNNEFLDVEIEIAADSGASEHVAADTDAPSYKVEESIGSRSGQHFVGAGGHRMANRGQMKLNMRADNGKKGRDVRTTFQVARVTRPLMSVSKICDAGMSMRFTSTMAVIEYAKGKEVCRFLRKGGLYIASMKLRNPSYKPPAVPFARQGDK